MIPRDSQPLDPIRKQEIVFHIQEDDYFVTLATVLDCLHQELDGKRRVKSENAAPVVRIKKDLLFLQKHHRIVEKR
jgi:hypothetical protein